MMYTRRHLVRHRDTVIDRDKGQRWVEKLGYGPERYIFLKVGTLALCVLFPLCKLDARWAEPQESSVYSFHWGGVSCFVFVFFLPLIVSVRFVCCLGGELPGHLRLFGGVPPGAGRRAERSCHLREGLQCLQGLVRRRIGRSLADHGLVRRRIGRSLADHGLVRRRIGRSLADHGLVRRRIGRSLADHGKGLLCLHWLVRRRIGRSWERPLMSSLAGEGL
jgi:hypothetical protein